MTLRATFSNLIRHHISEMGPKRLAQATNSSLSLVYGWQNGALPSADKLADIEKVIPGFINELYGLKPAVSPWQVERLPLPDDAPDPGCNQLFAPMGHLGPIHREAGPASWTSVLAVDGEEVKLLHTGPPKGIFEESKRMIGQNVLEWADVDYGRLTKHHMLEVITGKEPTHYRLKIPRGDKVWHYLRTAWMVAPGIIVTRSEKVAA